MLKKRWNCAAIVEIEFENTVGDGVAGIIGVPWL